MLTKEESKLIFRKITEELEDESDDQDGYFRVSQYLDKFTEKPKREIQVGDIYRCKSGRIHEIQKIDESQIETSIDFYNLDGTYYGDGIEDPDCKQDDLDLSKRYKLVEVDDE